MMAKNGAKFQQLTCDNAGRLECSVDALEITADNINLNVDEVEGKLDTINSTLTSGIGGLVLPTALTGSGNLKVSLQELGNEGSERLNVDVGSTVSQLPTALTGEGNLKVSIQEDFTHNLSTSAKQDTINTTLGTLSTSAKQDTINTTLGTLSTHAKQDTTNGHLSALASIVNPAIATATATTIPTKLDTINSSIGDLATESTLNIIAEEFTKCDTDNVVITGGVVLPAALTGGGNLKVCIQELGNEGSERLNVDIGNAVAQLPTALSGSGRLKIENDISGFATSANQTTINGTLGTINNQFRSQWSNGVGGGTALGPAVALLATEATLTEIEGAVETIEGCVGSNKLNVNISSGNITGFATDSNLVAMSAKLPATLGQKANASSMSVCRTNTTGAYDLSGRTTIGTASTSTKLLCNTAGNLVVATTAEDKEVIDDDAISPNTLSVVIDTEHYEKIRLYGNSTTSVGSDLTCFGSNDALGTYYHLPNSDFQANTLTISGGSAINYLGVVLENIPRFIKIFNKSGGSTYTISKLRMVGSGGRLAV